MAPTKQELSLLINPLVPEAVQHNNRPNSLPPRHLRWNPRSPISRRLRLLLRRHSSRIRLVPPRPPPAVRRRRLRCVLPGQQGGEIDGQVDMDRRGVVRMSLNGAKKEGRRFVLRSGAWQDLWLGGGVMSEALSGFVLGWAGVGGVLR
ncbi:hypothetical protein N7470_008115 [Penicillium chermesinum]|nr:hypothetical protein N7470_008115 [Penicillium chermesinum]